MYYASSFLCSVEALSSGLPPIPSPAVMRAVCTFLLIAFTFGLAARKQFSLREQRTIVILMHADFQVCTASVAAVIHAEADELIIPVFFRFPAVLNGDGTSIRQNVGAATQPALSLAENFTCRSE